MPLSVMTAAALSFCSCHAIFCTLTLPPPRAAGRPQAAPAHNIKYLTCATIPWQAEVAAHEQTKGSLAEHKQRLAETEQARAELVVKHQQLHEEHADLQAEHGNLKEVHAATLSQLSDTRQQLQRTAEQKAAAEHSLAEHKQALSVRRRVLPNVNLCVHVLNCVVALVLRSKLWGRCGAVRCPVHHFRRKCV